MADENQKPDQTNDGPILRAESLSRVFRVGKSEIRALSDVSVSVRAGEALCIMGASGAGKSTLLAILGGLDHPDTGRVFFKNREVYRLSAAQRTRMRAREIGFVFQSYHLLPELDVLENVLLPAMTRLDYPRRAAAAHEKARGLLREVGLAERAAHKPAELSGGEQQRVALARALMNDPELLCADEPTGNLDSETGAQVLDYLFALTRERGHTLILVTHNHEIAACCDRKIVLKDGCLVV